MCHHRRLFSKCFYSSCALFVIGIIVYDYNRYPTESYDRLSTDDNGIEQRLEQIPTCTSDDRSRQRALLYTLQEWTRFAQQHHIQYWIAYGTLLGYVQRHGLLPHDSNIDLFIMAQDTPSLITLSQFNFSSTYKLKVHPQWNIPGYIKRSYYYSQGIDFVAPNARFVNLKSKVYLNIWAIYDDKRNDSKTITSKAMLISYDKDYQWKLSPKEWTFPLDDCEFNGIDVWCPADPEKLVVDLYGKLGVNMSSITGVNDLWVKSDEYISAERQMDMISETNSTKETTNIHTTLQTTHANSTDDQNLIEKALETIETCTPDDRNRQRIILTTLQAWSQLAEKYNLEYWIVYGSLIGYIQRGGLLPHDADVDITIMSNDTSILTRMSPSNYSSDYEIKIQPQWQIPSYKNRSYFYDKGINFVAPNARFIHRKTGLHVDIWPTYDFNPHHSKKSTKRQQSEETLTDYGLRYGWLTHPRNYTYPLKTCYFSKIKILCPANPEKLVKAVYGVTALSKSDTKCVNGSWVAAEEKNE